jgi:RNA polymerase sigma factor (sigma-70 family)
MPTPDQLAEQFEEHRPHLRAVAYRMLGSAAEAEDAVQESWIRLGTDVSGVENLRAWLTTVVSRVCLDMLRTRTSRREDPLDTHVPDPVHRDEHPGGSRSAGAIGSVRYRVTHLVPIHHACQQALASPSTSKATSSRANRF